MENNYVILKRKHSNELNNFKGIFYAFSNSQFYEGMVDIGLGKDETGKIVSIGSGGYLLKSKVNDFRNMFKQHRKEMKALKADKENLLNALIYELRNYEYCYTHDYIPALNALDLTEDTVDKELLKIACNLTKNED